MGFSRLRLLFVWLTVSLLLGACGPDGPSLFVNGPHVPGGDLPFELPPLRIEPSEAFGREKEVLALLWRGEDGSGQVRLSFSPKDEGQVIRPYEWSDLQGLLDRDPKPALVYVAPPDGYPGFPPVARTYFAGRTKDGRLGVIPYMLNDGVVESFGVYGQGSQFAFPAELAMVELRITREGAAVRYRWGLWPHRLGPIPGPRWLQDVTIPEAEVRADGDDVLLPGLAELLAAPQEIVWGCRVFVVVVTGPDAVYVDLLRAVECARGDARVLFCSPWRQREKEVLTVPAPSSAFDERVLREIYDGPELRFLNISADERSGEWSYFIRRVWFSPEQPEQVELFDVMQIRADVHAPWRILHPMLRRMQIEGRRLLIAFVPEEAAVGFPERFVEVPLARPGEQGETLSFPEDRPWSEIAPEILHRIAEGEGPFDFR